MTQRNTILNRYQIAEKIGSGGFASVFNARDLSLDRDVAIKISTSEISDEVKDIERFENEARMLAKVRHPNVVQVFDFGVIDNQPFIVMEKLEGEDFSRVIDRGDLPEKKLERLILGALDGLGTAHKLGLVHKDLKPQNLFLAEDISGERLVVIDYGFGRRLGREADRLTQTGKIGGSPSYLPPEYIEEYNVCPQNDVYQMALIIIEAFTGEKVVNHEGVWEAISAHLNGELRVPDSFKQHRWYPVVLQALDRDLAVRFADANVFAENLKQQEEPTQDPTTPPVLKSKHLRFETTETTCELTNTAETNVFAYILTVAAACAVVVSFWFTAWIWTLTAAVATFVAIGAILFVDSDCQKIRVSDFDVVVTRKKPRRYPLVDVKSFNVSKRGVIMKVGWKSVPILQSLNADDALKVAHYLNATLERLRAS